MSSAVETFVATLSRRQMANLAQILENAEEREQLRHLLTQVRTTAQVAERGIVPEGDPTPDAAELPRRGTNHTHPPRPGQPCPVCGV